MAMVLGCGPARPASPSPAEVPVASPDDPKTGELTTLCREKPTDLDGEEAFRGVTVKENGSARCCPLDGSAFMCVMRDGHQHEALLVDRARFYVSPDAAPVLEIDSEVGENHGMSQPSEPLVSLRVKVMPRGELVLVAEPAGACTPLMPTSLSPCKHQGRYRFSSGVPVRMSKGTAE